MGWTSGLCWQDAAPLSMWSRMGPLAQVALWPMGCRTADSQLAPGCSYLEVRRQLSQAAPGFLALADYRLISLHQETAHTRPGPRPDFASPVGSSRVVAQGPCLGMQVFRPCGFLVAWLSGHHCLSGKQGAGDAARHQRVEETAAVPALVNTCFISLEGSYPGREQASVH